MAVTGSTWRREYALQTAMCIKHDSLLNDPATPPDVKRYHASRIAASPMIARQSDLDSGTSIAKSVIRGGICGGGDVDDLLYFHGQ